MLQAVLLLPVSQISCKQVAGSVNVNLAHVISLFRYYVVLIFFLYSNKSSYCSFNQTLLNHPCNENFDSLHLDVTFSESTFLGAAKQFQLRAPFMLTFAPLIEAASSFPSKLCVDTASSVIASSCFFLALGLCL